MRLMDLQRRINQPVSHRARRNLGRHLLAASYRAFLDPEQTALGRIAPGLFNALFLDRVSPKCHTLTQTAIG